MGAQVADEIDTRSPAGPLLNWSRTAGPWARVSTDKNLVLDVPKETKPPLVVRWCTFSPRSSGGGIGDQLHLGALANEFPTSCSSCNNNKRFIRRRVTYVHGCDANACRHTWKKEVAMARSVSSLKRMGKMAFIFSACRAYVYVGSIVSEHKHMGQSVLH